MINKERSFTAAVTNGKGQFKSDLKTQNAAIFTSVYECLRLNIGNQFSVVEVKNVFCYVKNPV